MNLLFLLRAVLELYKILAEEIEIDNDENLYNEMLNKIIECLKKPKRCLAFPRMKYTFGIILQFGFGQIVKKLIDGKINLEIN